MQFQQWHGDELTGGLSEAELKELADVSASFDIRPRRRLQYLATFMALLGLVFSIVGESKVYSEADHLKFCDGKIDSSGAGTWAVVALLLIVAAFTMVISGPNECCNAVFCMRYGLKTFNAGLWLMLGWVFFAFGVCCLYFGAVRELNHDCPKEIENTYEVIVEGFIVAGGVMGFLGTCFACFYYGDSMTLAGLQAEKGLLVAKQKMISGNGQPGSAMRTQADEENGTFGGAAMVPMEETNRT
ncbi:15-cis-zeta-carotene isomerase [Chloropicon primus]|nr:15-cis-zeta-carotene isomerase [Chloropicon primus]